MTFVNGNFAAYLYQVREGIWLVQTIENNVSTLNREFNNYEFALYKYGQIVGLSIGRSKQ